MVIENRFCKPDPPFHATWTHNHRKLLFFSFFPVSQRKNTSPADTGALFKCTVVVQLGVVVVATPAALEVVHQFLIALLALQVQRP